MQARYLLGACGKWRRDVSNKVGLSGLHLRQSGLIVRNDLEGHHVDLGHAPPVLVERLELGILVLALLDESERSGPDRVFAESFVSDMLDIILWYDHPEEIHVVEQGGVALLQGYPRCVLVDDLDIADVGSQRAGSRIAQRRIDRALPAETYILCGDVIA